MKVKDFVLSPLGLDENRGNVTNRWALTSVGTIDRVALEHWT